MSLYVPAITPELINPRVKPDRDKPEVTDNSWTLPKEPTRPKILLPLTVCILVYETTLLDIVVVIPAVPEPEISPDKVIKLLSSTLLEPDVIIPLEFTVTLLYVPAITPEFDNPRVIPEKLKPDVTASSWILPKEPTRPSNLLALTVWILA